MLSKHITRSKPQKYALSNTSTTMSTPLLNGNLHAPTATSTSTTTLHHLLNYTQPRHITSISSTSTFRTSYPTSPTFGRYHLPRIDNEPQYDYSPNSPEAIKLQEAIEELKSKTIDIPIIINGKEIREGQPHKVVMPSKHAHVLGTYYEATGQHTQDAINAALRASKEWADMSFESRASIFLKAADLLSSKYRYIANAATVLGQAKNYWQAEIDSAAEQCDFYRFNVKYAQEIYEQQPPENSKYVWNRLEYRPLEGFVLAITPFNFAAIGANLPTAPALMGNVVLWKPSSTSLLGNYVTMKILQEAGLPDGVINFLPSPRGVEVSKIAFSHSDFAGLHFTGSTKTFKALYRQISDHLDIYKSYPRIVGETGGKNFHFVHASADPSLVIHQTIRGAFEYSGQKCSATSRAYIPDSLWDQVKQGLIKECNEIIGNNFGQPDHADTFLSAVIDENSFNRLSSAIDKIKDDPDLTILAGGNYNKSEGYFIEPTIVQTKNPKSWLMSEELFGPVVCIYVYPRDEFESTLELCDQTVSYGLTGSIFARDRYAIDFASYKLRNAAGNFYINDKCTGAVVGQQPFGGARASGTNDKAGSHLNLLRWVSARNTKENFVPIHDWRYPHQPNQGG